MKSKLFKISEFSVATGLSIKALRLYEQSGILIPSRSEANQYRLYSEAQIPVAKEISILRLTGFSIREIKALLPFRHHADGGTLVLLQQQLLKTERTMAALSVQCKQLKSLISHTMKRTKAEPKGLPALFARRLVCKEISESIKQLSHQQVMEKTKQISSDAYLRTVAMVDDIARVKLLSVISEKAVKLVEDDLAQLDRQYAKFWK